MITSHNDGAEIQAKWACPKCGAGANDHGKGGEEKCAGRNVTYQSGCMGFICECEDEAVGETHGITFEDPCKSANCYHCGWGGTVPKKPKGLQGWEKKALEAGWTPPPNRCAELGLTTNAKTQSPVPSDNP